MDPSILAPRILAVLSSMVFLVPGPSARSEEPSADTMIIDDFQDPSGQAAAGGQWRIFTDQVMGGVSVARGAIEVLDDERCLRLVGEVSLENNGGFVQAALDLGSGSRALDARPYLGLRIRARGQSGAYYIHLRTDDCRLPWQYYAAKLTITTEWTDLEIPFSRFEPAALSTQIDVSSLRRIGIVAAKEEFSADVAVSRIELYR
jgi:hypothetical protein